MLPTVNSNGALALGLRLRWKAVDEHRPADRGRTANLAGSAARDSQRKGDERVSEQDFDALFEKYYKSVFNVIYQWIGDQDEAADLTQETFVSAYKAIGQFRGESRIYTWLYRIAHNHCKNRFKQRDRQRRSEGPSLDAGAGLEGDMDGAAPPIEVADWTYSPADLLEQQELRSLIDAAVNGLASEYKVVLVLREIEGLAYSEIAEVTGLTMEAVKTRLNRARAMVRQKVEPYIRP